MTDELVAPNRTRLVVEALGIRVTIESSAADAAAVRQAWSGAVRSGGHVGASESGVRGDDNVHADQTDEPGQTDQTDHADHSDHTVDAGDPLDLASLSTAVTLAAINARRGELLMLHACGLARADGAVAAFVAASGTGKTTLASVLGQHLGYVSDETVAITADGTVLPYRKPLSIIRNAGAAKVQLSPDELGLGALPCSPSGAPAPLRITSVTLIERVTEPGALADDRPVIERMPTIDAIAALVPQISYLTDLADASGRADGLARIAALGALVGGFRRVRYREATDLASRLDELFGSLPDDPDEASAPPESLVIGIEAAIEPGIGERIVSGGPARDTVWMRSPGIQWIDDGDRVATFAGGMLRTLDGVGAALWRAISAPADLQHLTAAVVEELGPAPDGDAAPLVAAALEQLGDAGLVHLLGSSGALV